MRKRKNENVKSNNLPEETGTSTGKHKNENKHKNINVNG